MRRQDLETNSSTHSKFFQSMSLPGAELLSWGIVHDRENTNIEPLCCP